MPLLERGSPFFIFTGFSELSSALAEVKEVLNPLQTLMSMMPAQSNLSSRIWATVGESSNAKDVQHGLLWGFLEAT